MFARPYTSSALTDAKLKKQKPPKNRRTQPDTKIGSTSYTLDTIEDTGEKVVIAWVELIVLSEYVRRMIHLNGVTLKNSTSPKVEWVRIDLLYYRYS